MGKVIAFIFTSFLVVSILTLSTGCKSHKSSGIYYVDSTRTVNAVRVDIWQLLPTYNGKFVEIEGLYRHGFEVSALFPSKSSKGRHAIWVDFTRNLTNPQTKKQLFGKDFKEVEKLYDRKVKLIGVFDKDTKGHLDAYFGGITNIVSVEVIE